MLALTLDSSVSLIDVRREKVFGSQRESVPPGKGRSSQ
jgi:hypothetical protein